MRKVLIAVFISILLPCVANAALFYLDETNDTRSLNAGPWAAVTLTDTTSANGRDGVHFVVDPIESAFAGTGSNFGLQSFYFNEATAFGRLMSIENFNPTGWSVSYSSDQRYNPGGDFGKFEFITSGTGSTRANPLSFDVFAPLGYNITIADLSTVFSTEGYLFAAHIAGYGSSGTNSAKFATDSPATASVPEPGTMMLLGSGLVGLVGFGRKKFRK